MVVFVVRGKRGLKEVRLRVEESGRVRDMDVEGRKAEGRVIVLMELFFISVTALLALYNCVGQTCGKGLVVREWIW